MKKLPVFTIAIIVAYVYLMWSFLSVAFGYRESGVNGYFFAAMWLTIWLIFVLIRLVENKELP